MFNAVAANNFVADPESEMVNFKNLSRSICAGLYFFLTGTEYAIILPTLNGYLNYLGAERYFLGLVLAGFSLTALISAPIYGRISDRTRTSKPCVIVGNVFEIGGNFMYFASFNKYMALSSRFIAGMGAGAASSLYGMISRTTSEEERTKAFSRCLLLRQLGIVVGPAFNVFLNSIDLSLGPFTVNSYNAPGLLMALVWTLHTVLIVIFYKEPDVVSCSVTEGDHSKKHSSSPSSGCENINPSSQKSDVLVTTRSFKDEFLRDEVIVCLTSSFLGIFAQSGMETALAPLSKLFFNWAGLQNSYLFGAGGAIIAVGYVSLSFVSKRVSDRALLLYGVVGIVGVYIMYTTVYLILRIHPEKVDDAWMMPVFISIIALLTLVLPYAWVSQASIFSKITSTETQSFNQGIRLVSIGLGQILGPVWASSLTTLDGLPIMVGVYLCLNVMLLIMIICSYKRLQSPTEIGTSRGDNLHVTRGNDTPERYNESSPLLSA